MTSETTACRFCDGKVVKADAVGKGIKTMRMMLGMMFGVGDDDDDGECMDGIQLQLGNKLAFESSSGEYAPLYVKIQYCPFCGKPLTEEKGQEAKS